MPSIQLPYGRGHLSLNIPHNRLAGVLTSRLAQASPKLSQSETVKMTLRSPTGSPALSQLARGKQNIVVITSDHTRPVPSRILSPAIIDEIRSVNPEAEITFLIATGCHRATTHAELCEKFGKEFVESRRIEVHDCDRSETVNMGKLPSGGELVLNKTALQADLLLAEGFIEPHFFAGFSGGPKSVLPGVASRQTVLYNHNSHFIAHPSARTGITQDNPMHIDMRFAARQAKLCFICNVLLNAKQEIVFAAAGEPEAAHRAGCEELKKHCGVKAVLADIVITTNGGYPLDQNIYQAVKSMTAAEACVRPGGVIIALSQCADGHGGEDFFNTFAQSPNPRHILRRIESTPAHETAIDQWQSQIFARVLSKARVIFVSDVSDEIVKAFHMIPAKTPDEALELAGSLLGEPDASVLAIPDGVSVIVE